ncbi:hypothetical protein ACIBI4_24190 [Streptomyces sp. NPDC050418]|uniref:hypothetical protein n=1 Tax=Streptomyces sp. NPDC050418 TaxID=3365612 RepID=UPI0037B8FF88
MIVIPDARTAALYEQWQPVGAATERSVAEPLVLDCIRRLTAEPGGGTAHVWVAGLAEMTRYLAWSPAPGTARAAVDALLAASAALDEGACGHESHAYERELPELDEYDTPSGWYLIGESEETPRQDGDLCPRNVAGVARLVADVIAPYSAGRISRASADDSDDAYEDFEDFEDEDYESEVGSLLDFLNDYPTMEPGPTIEANAGAPGEGSTRGLVAGYIVTQHVSTPYVYYRIMDRSVYDAMIEGLEQALELLDAYGITCPHAEGEHPDLEEIYYESEAETAVLLRTPAGRQHLAGQLDDGEPELWVCPGFLRELAEDALGQLRPRHGELFAARDLEGLDARFVHADGRLDIAALTEVIAAAESQYASGTAGENAGLWAARRHADTAEPHERLVLLHLALWTAELLDLPYGVGREIRALLRTVDQEPLDHACPHGDAHPDADLRRTFRRERMKPHLDHLYAPGEFAAPQGAFAADVWGCPALLARWAQTSIEELDEAYEEMDEEDGDEESILR